MANDHHWITAKAAVRERVKWPDQLHRCGNDYDYPGGLYISGSIHYSIHYPSSSSDSDSSSYLSHRRLYGH